VQSEQVPPSTQGLYKDDIGTRFRVDLAPGDRLVEADDSPGIRAADDDEITAPRIHDRLDLADHLSGGDHFFPFKVAAFLWEDLVLDLDGGRTCGFSLPYGSQDIQGIAVACIHIDDHRNFHRSRDPPDLLHRLRQGHKADVGIAELAHGNGRSGQVDGFKSGLNCVPRTMGIKDTRTSKGRALQEVFLMLWLYPFFQSPLKRKSLGVRRKP